MVILTGCDFNKRSCSRVCMPPPSSLRQSVERIVILHTVRNPVKPQAPLMMKGSCFFVKASLLGTSEHRIDRFYFVAILQHRSVKCAHEMHPGIVAHGMIHTVSNVVLTERKGIVVTHTVANPRVFTGAVGVAFPKGGRVGWGL